MTDEGFDDVQERDQEAAESTIQFDWPVSQGRDGFLRRNCSSCGRDFKTEIDPADFAWALSAQIRRVSLEIGVEPAEIAEDVDQASVTCPYCRYSAESSEMHTEETIEYLKRFAYRDYALPMLNRMFSDFADSLTGGSGSGGFISISISVDHNKLPLPPRPLHEPEPGDMKIGGILCFWGTGKVVATLIDRNVCMVC